MATRARSADFDTWRGKVAAVGGCAAPIRLSGARQIQDATTGAVLDHHGGHIFAPCGNRRESVCPSCSDRYAADAFHLVRAGLIGGEKGVTDRVTDHPRAFATLTAPSFGPVHTRRETARGRIVPCHCGQRHRDGDTRLSTPVDPDTYDYTGAVLWQAHSGPLWQRFTMRLRRELAKAAGIRVRDFAEHARLSYGKVAEYQQRGLVHFHAVIRIDGPTGPDDPPPSWAGNELLQAAIHAAAAAVTVTTERPDGTPLVLRWGSQVDVRPIRQTSADQFADQAGELSDAQLAGYIAKYATKGTNISEGADKPIRSEGHIDYLRISEHHRRMIRTAWNLGGHDQYADLNLRRWAHMLGFRGHFLTKSHRYSSTFRAIREQQRAYRLGQTLDALGLDAENVTVVNDWRFAGAGYRDDAERELAAGIADRIRTDRQQRYEQEHQ